MPNPHRSTGVADETLPAICLITADEDFQGEIEAELAPWYRVRHRNHYGDTALWVREQRAQAVLVDIDTQGEEAHAGVRGVGGGRRPLRRGGARRCLRVLA